MEKRNWKALAREFREMVKNTTDATKVIVKVGDNDIAIYPAKTNHTKAFYCTEELIDFCRCKRLSNHVTVIDGVCVAKIY